MLSLDRKKLYKILEISSIFVGVLMALYYFYPVFASPPTTPYAPGETTDPSCSPGDTNCTVYPPLTTSLTTSTAIIMGTSALRFAYDSTNYTSFNVASDGGLTVSSTNSATTTFINKVSFLSNAYFNTIASGTWNGVAIAVAYGGTNSSTISANGSIIYSDGTRYNSSAVGTAGQFLQSSGSGAPVWVNSTSMGFVNLQGATAGTQQTGNLNISGTGLFGTRVGINTTTLTSYALAVSGTTYTADLIAKGGVYVDVRAYGATNDGSTDSTAAIQAAVNAAYLNLSNAVGGVVYFPAGIYAITGTITISNSRVHLMGAGKNATFISFTPASTGLPAFKFSGGASVLYQNSISKMSINGADSVAALQKIGIQLTDTSEMTVEDISMLRMNGSSSIGISLNGREMTTFNRISIGADRPIVIGDNPNHTIDVDHLHVQDAYLIASGTNPNVTIESGVNLTNVVFDGTQAWVLGGHGLQWIDTSSAAASANLTLKNVRWEQSTNANGYLVDIEHNYILQNLVMENMYGGLSTNGIKLRNINWATLENFMYVDTAKTAIDVNTNTRPLVLKNVFLQTGSTSTFGGLTTIMDTGRSTQGGTTYAMAVFDIPSASSVTTFNRIGIGTSSPVAFLSVLASSTNGNNPILEIASSSGSSFLRILANGNVGIGTGIPLALLHLNKTTDVTNTIALELGRTSSGQSPINRTVDLAFSDGPNKGFTSGISAIRDNAAGNWNSQLAFYTSNDNTAGATTVQGLNEWMRITSAGRVGIGTTTPIATLSVVATSSNGNNPILEIASSSGSSFLRILANGNVGIGSSTPSEKLSITGNIGLSSSALTFGAGGGEIRTTINSTTAYRFLSVQSDAANAGPFTIGMYSALFNGTRDPVMGWGYNMDNGGVAIQSGEPGLLWQVEGNYNDNSGDNKMESYLQYLSATGTLLRPIFWQINRDTNYVTAQLNSDVITFNDRTASTTNFSFSTNNLVMNGDTSAPSTLQINSGAGQQGILALGFNGTANYVQMYSGASNTASFYVNSQNVLNLYSSPIGAPGAAIAVGVNDNSAVGVFDVVASNAGVKGLVVRAKSTQTANIFEAQNSASIPLVVISPTGKFGIGTSSPIATLSVVATSSNGNNPIFEVASSSGSSFLRVLANGNVGINTTTPVSTFAVVGTTTITGGILVGDGTATVPSYSFINDSDTGLWLDSAGNSFGAAVNGGYSIRFFSGGFTTGGGGTVSAPAITFAGDTNTGFWAPAAEQLAIATNGINRLTVSTTAFAFNPLNLPGFNIGIGTTTPIATFAIQGNTSSNPFAIVSSSGASFLHILQNGNVGIGTSSPSEKLEVKVNSNSVLNNALSLRNTAGQEKMGTAIIYYSDAQDSGGGEFNSGRIWSGFDGASYATARISLQTPTAAATWINALNLKNGNVGVNTTSPLARLTVQGSGTENPFLIVSSTAAATSMFTILTNGNVGINTSSPTALLSVQGNGNSSTTNSFTVYNASSSLTLGAKDDGSVIINDGAVYHDGAGAVTYINSLETGNFSFPDDAGTVTWTNLNASSSAVGTVQSYTASIGDNPMITVYGESDGTGGIKSTSTMLGIGTSTPQYFVDIWTTSSPQGLFRIATTTNLGILSVLSNGNVGIGSSTPSNPLTVQSDTAQLKLATMSGPGSYNTTLSAIYNSAHPFALTVTNAGNSLENIGIYADSGGGNRRITLLNANVAINTTTNVGTKFIIQGDGTTNPFSVVSSTYSSMFTILTNGSVGINTSSPIAMLAVQGFDGINPFSVNSSTGASMLNVLTNGLVGIGVDTPLVGLHIVDSGNLGLRVARSAVPSQYISMRTNSGSHGITGSGEKLFQFSNESTVYGLEFLVATNFKALNIGVEGRVGINSSSPFAQLTVQGIASSSPLIDFASSSGASFMRILANGNVGISTSTPLAKLTVQGSGNTSSTLALNTFSASGTSTFKIDDAGNASFANDGFYYEASSSVSYVNSLETGSINFDDNAGFVSWVDMEVSSTVAGTGNSYTASMDGNPMIMVYGDSNGIGGVGNLTVSIGTSTTSTYKVYIDAGVSTTAGLGVNGYIKATGYIAGTSTLDIAETYPVDPECDANGNCPQIGDVVCSAEDTSSTFFIEQCASTSTDRIIGVVSGNPGFILGGYDVKDIKIKGLYPTSFRPIALAGRVPVSVSVENGPIKAGDYLTSSAVPGVAVKAVEPGKVIGMALQSFDGSVSATGTVTVFVNTSWSPGSAVALNETDEAIFPDFATVVLDKFTLAVKNSLRKLGLLVKDGIATVKEVFADKVTTQQLCVGNTCVNESQLQEILNKTQTQAAPVSPSSQEGAGGVAEVVIESPIVTTTPIVIPTTTPPAVIPAETEVSSSTPDTDIPDEPVDVTIPVEPVIVNIETTTP